MELRRAGSVRVRELVEALGVSEMTVRRDLDELRVRGLLEKVHGGAIRRQDRTADEPGFAAKSDREQHEKHAIARRAMQMVGPGAAIGLTAGTTTFALAKLLVEVPALTVVTNSVRVADVFHASGRTDTTVVLVGGVRTRSEALVGPVALTTLRSLHVELLFMGVHGMDEDAGFTTPNLLEAETNRAFLRAAQRCVVLADHTKWGVRALSSISALHQAECVITDDRLGEAATEALTSHTSVLHVTTSRPHAVEVG